MRRRFINTTFVIAVAAALAATAAGQSAATSAPTGRVYGTVFDRNRAVIAGARVVFESGGARREVLTNEEGFYEAWLPVRTYTEKIEAMGFCPFRKNSVRVVPGGVTSVNAVLHVAAIVHYVEIKDGKYGREGGRLDDSMTNRPCAPEAPADTPDVNAPPPVLLTSAQRSAAKRPAAKTAAAAKSSLKTAPKPSNKIAAKPSASGGVVNISTQPGAVVWVDEVRRGAADAEGKLQLKLTPGRHALRVRAAGYAERTLPILPTQRGALSVVLTKTTDQAELLFQQAEEAREKGNAAGAVELYRQALKLRPRFAAAHLGLARALESQENFDEALEEIQAARGVRPVYPEASAVEGRILRSLADPEAALAAYRRALRESRGFQPEAYTGIGIVYEDRAQNEEAVAAFRKAVAQLSDTEPILYELLARNLEKLERWKEAVAAYEKYLELAPTGAHASAINSIIDQLRKQAAEAEQQQQPPR